MSTFLRRRNWSSEVSTAFTTRTASPGSLLRAALDRAAVMDSTSSISTTTLQGGRERGQVGRQCDVEWVGDTEGHGVRKDEK